MRVEHWNPAWGPLNEANMRRRLEIGAGHDPVILGPGDMIEIPDCLAHTAEVVGAETVISLDATRTVKKHGEKHGD